MKLKSSNDIISFFKDSLPNILIPASQTFIKLF